jgi:SAM-dependent methyltransferase
LAESVSYSSSQFFPGVPLGSTHGGFRCEDLQQLTFPGESLDLFVSQDVMEHIPQPELAFAEIARVLRPGGAHVFTVPIYSQSETLVRADVDESGKVRLLTDADYHGNPVSDQGSLVIREWGADIVEFIREHSNLETEVIRLHDRSRGLDGEFLQVLVSRKP